MSQYHGCNLRSGRVSIPGQTYLVTTVTYNRQKLFKDFAIGRIVVDSLRYMEQEQRVGSLAFVVMPDHLHWLFALATNQHLSQGVASIKGYSAHSINKHLQHTNAPIWQRGFHDHVIRKEREMRDTARYIVANPLRAGLVKHVGDYPLWDAVWL